MIENEYLKITKDPMIIHGGFKSRRALVSKYAWAIPNDKALYTLKKYSTIVEIGAGTGYWAYLANDRGADVICYDKFLGDANDYKHTKNWVDVKHGDESILESFDPDVNLFLCWPPYDNPMAKNCLDKFKGEYVLYVGEGFDGCNGDDDFHNCLYNYWVEIKHIVIPRWDAIYDDLTVYRRK